MVLEEGVHFPPQGRRRLCTWPGYGNCRSRVRKAQGMVQRGPFSQGDCKRGIERIPRRCGVPNLDRKSRKMGLDRAGVRIAPLLTQLNNDGPWSALP